MFGVYKELSQSTAVTHCVTGRVLPGLETLVVATSHSLRIYSLSSESSLMLHHSLPLHGEVVSVTLSRFPNHTLDSILLTTAPGKLSTLHYSSKHGGFRTVSMFNFDASLGKLVYPVTAVDPTHRCAGMIVSSHSIAIIPSETLANNLTTTKSVANTPEDDSFFVKDLSDYGVKRLRDVVFLHGYLEPTILVRHEPVLTWEGRYSVRRNSQQLLAFSIDMTRRTLSLICSSEMLPADTHTLLPVSGPIGGVLVFSSNLILHFTHSVGYAMSLNQFTDEVDDFRVAPQPSQLVMTLESELGAVQLDPSNVLLTDSSGTLYLLHMLHQGTTLTHMDVTVVGNAEVSSCMTRCSNDHVFLGSYIGDSALYKYTASVMEANNSDARPNSSVTENTPTHDSDATHADATNVDATNPDATRMNNDTEMDVDAPGDAMDVDTGELEVDLFGARIELEQVTVSDDQHLSYEFQLVDTLVNIGPIAQFAIGSTSLTPTRERDVESTSSSQDLVVCSSRGANGVLSILRNGVTPVPRHSFDFQQEVLGCWTARLSSQPDTDAYTVVSFDRATLVLSTLEDLKPLASNDSGFITNDRTFVMGPLDAGILVQVCSNAVVLVDESLKLLQRLQLGNASAGVRVAHAELMAPYIMLQLSDGSLEVLTMASGSLSRTPVRLHRVDDAHAESFETDAGVQAATLALDTSGVVAAHSLGAADHVAHPTAQDEHMELEERLFGHRESAPEPTPDVPSDTPDTCNTAFLSVVRTDGRLEVYTLPDLALVYWCSALAEGHPRYDNLLLNDHPAAPTTDSAVVSLVVSGPHLYALLDSGALLVYTMFAFESAPGHVPLRLSRYQHSLLLSADSSERHLSVFSSPQSSGVFVSGSDPVWIFTDRGSLYPHTQRGASVRCMTSFSAPICRQGFLSFSGGVLSLSTLPDARYDCAFVTTRVPLGKTPVAVAYDDESGAYAVVVADRQEILSMELPTARSLKNYEDAYQLLLFTAGTFALVSTYASFQEHEAVLCAKVASLLRFRTPKQIGPVTDDYFRRRRGDPDRFIAVGTSNAQGEEHLCQGRVLLFEVYDESPSDKSGSGLRFKMVHDFRARGPVTQVESVRGALCLAIGSRVIMHRWDGVKLAGCAFYDAGLYVTHMSSLKHFIQLGDIAQGVHLVYWDHLNRQLMFVSKDVEHRQVSATQFLVDTASGELALVVADTSRNLFTLRYSPERPESQRGEKLLQRSDFHSSALITHMALLASNNQFVTLMSGSTGQLALVIPVDEQVYRRLYSLHTQMTYRLAHTGGLNPRVFRAYKPPSEASPPLQRNMVDADLLWSFPQLSTPLQAKLAASIGTKPATVLDNLAQLRDSSTIL